MRRVCHPNQAWKVWRVSGLDAVRCLVLFKQVSCLFGKV